MRIYLFSLFSARRELPRLAAALFTALLLGACGAAAEAPAETREPVSSNRFDVERVRPGDRMGGLTVVSVDVQPSAVDDRYVGSVAFEGTARVRGVPFLLEDGGAPIVCFNLLEDAPNPLPRMRHDERRAWFCFENEREAHEALAGSIGRVVEVEVGEYRTVYAFTDSHDTVVLESADAGGEIAPLADRPPSP
jgi:hypothetical protein